MVKIVVLRSFKLTKTRRKNLWLTAKAVIRAEQKTERELLPTVAFKKGALRKGVKKAGLASVHRMTAMAINNRDTIKITFRKGDVTEPDYGKYHIHPGSKYGSTYQEPTTLGTFPLDTRTWNRRLAKNIIEELPKFGFKVTV